MACGALSQDLLKACGTSVPGVQVLYITEFDNKNTLTLSGSTATAFTLTTGKKFWKFQPNKFSSSFSQAETIDAPNGIKFYDQTVDFSYPRLAANTQGILDQLSNNDVMVIALGSDGNYWLLGSANGLSVTVSTANSGKAKTDAVGYAVTIGNGSEPYPMVQVPSALITTLTAPAV